MFPFPILRKIIWTEYVNLRSCNDNILPTTCEIIFSIYVGAAYTNFFFFWIEGFFFNRDYIGDIGHLVYGKFEAFQNAKNVPSNVLADRRSNYVFLDLTYTNTQSKDNSLHLYTNLPSFPERHWPVWSQMSRKRETTLNVL